MARRKIKIFAKQLENVDVEYLSLVDRGANRIPFRFTKSTGDDNMSIDLGKLFLRKSFKKGPQIVGVALAKNENTPTYEELLKAEGFTFSDEEGQESVRVAKSEDYGKDDDLTVLKLNDDVALMVTGLQKGLSTVPDSNSFQENIQKSGFAPGMRLATDVLMETMFNIMHTEGGKAPTVNNITKALEDYKTYVIGLAGAVPTKAFKIEESVISKGLLIREGKTNPNEVGDKIPGGDKVVGGEGPDSKAAAAAASAASAADEGDEGDEDKGGGDIVDDPDADVAASQAAADEVHKGNADGDLSSGGDTGDTAGAGDVSGGDSDGQGVSASADETVQKSDEVVAAGKQKPQTFDMQALMEGLGSMMDSKLETLKKSLKDEVDTLGTRIAGLEESNTKVENRLTKAEAKAMEAEEAMHGTMLDGARQTDIAPGAPIRKKESQGEGIFDNAFRFDGYEGR